MFKIAIKNLFERKFKTIFIYILFLLLITMILVFGGLKTFFNEYIEKLASESFAGKYYVTSYEYNATLEGLSSNFPNQIKEDILQNLQKKNIFNSKRIRIGAIIIDEIKSDIYFSIIFGIDPGKEKKIITSTKLTKNTFDKFDNILKDNLIIINAKFCEKNNIKIGDKLIVFIKHSSGYSLPYEFEIIDTYTNDLIEKFNLSSPMIFININYLRQIIGVSDNFCTDIVFKDEDKVDYIKRISSQNNLSFVRANESYNIFSGLVNFLSLFFLISEVLLILIIVVMILNSTLSSIFERKREIGTMFSLGISKFKIIKIFIFEYLFIFLISFLSSFFIYLILILITQSKGIKISFITYLIPYLRINFNIKYLFYSFFISLLIIFLGIIFPSLVISRLEIVNILREDK